MQLICVTIFHAARDCRSRSVTRLDGAKRGLLWPEPDVVPLLDGAPKGTVRDLAADVRVFRVS